ncbi:NUDIX hydrolase 15, mitochondrial, partial [Tanacetum coccineum]
MRHYDLYYRLLTHVFCRYLDDLEKVGSNDLLLAIADALQVRIVRVDYQGSKYGDVDDADTATREAKVEIGLDPSLVNVVTILEPFVSKHLLRVVPVIGLLSDRNLFNPVPNVGEVDDVFDAPLEMFLEDENRKSEEIEWMGSRILMHSFDYETGGK